MNARFFIMLLIAFILAGAAAWMAKNWVEGVNVQNAEQGVVPVVAAAIEIPFGTKIETAHVKMLGWPKDHVPKGALSDTKMAIGKIAQRAFVTDEALLDPQVKDKPAGSILSSIIPEGKRAMSLPVNDVSGVAGFITPGNMVDIIATKSSTNKTYILLSNVKVLAIDQLASLEQDKPAVVRALTLEVTSEESTVLVKAMRDGPLYFTLRNPVDKQNVAESSSAQDIPQVQPIINSSEKKSSSVSETTVHPVKPRVTIIDWPTGQKRASQEQGAQ